MPFDCAHRARHGSAECLTACPTLVDGGVFNFARVEHDTPPPADPRVVDVALLDMHHGWPNLGHEALVHLLQTAACDMGEHLSRNGLSIRVISYDIRRGSQLPESPGGRHAIYVGTGGPGHLDPRRNDGSPGSQGIVEDPSWEAPLFELFDAIREDGTASLFGVCQTFGVMCRWLGVADAGLRGPDKGGKSVGVQHNMLTQAGREHPWFSRFAGQLDPRPCFPILDNRLYDLLPTGPAPAGVQVLSVECDAAGNPGDAVTMIGVARPSDRGTPTILGVNHHPEIVNRDRQLILLEKKAARGDVDEAWLAERMAALTQPVDNDIDDRALHLTSSYTLMGPVRLALYRAVHRAAIQVGADPGFDVHELPLAHRPEDMASLLL